MPRFRVKKIACLWASQGLLGLWLFSALLLPEGTYNLEFVWTEDHGLERSSKGWVYVDNNFFFVGVDSREKFVHWGKQFAWNSPFYNFQYFWMQERQVYFKYNPDND